MVQTAAERLRRQAGIRHPDTRLYRTGAPMATLQHVLTECAGSKKGGATRKALVQALRDMEQAVPVDTREDLAANKAYRKVIYEAKMRLQAGDAAALGERRWRRLEEVLAGCVPDFGRIKSMGTGGRW